MVRQHHQRNVRLIAVALLLATGGAVQAAAAPRMDKPLTDTPGDPANGRKLALAFDKGVVADLLKLRLPQHLGEWSYGIYLGQTFWLQYMRVIEFHFYPAPGTPFLGVTFADFIFWAEPIVLLLVCTAWGALLATRIEIPAAKWLRARLDRPRPAAPTSGIT